MATLWTPQVAEMQVQYSAALEIFVFVTIPFMSTVVEMRTSPTPQGPWSTPVAVYRIPTPQNNTAKFFCYAAMQHELSSLPRPNRPTLVSQAVDIVFTYVCNGRTLGDVYAPGAWASYIPQFVRLRLSKTGTQAKTDVVRGWARMSGTVDPAELLPGPAVSPIFLGLFTATLQGALLFGPAAAPPVGVAQALLNLKQMTPGYLGGPVLRVGGSSADSSCWGSVADGNQSCMHNGAFVPCCAYNTTRHDLDAYAVFAGVDGTIGTLRSLNGSFAIGTNLGYGPDPARAAAEVAAIARHRVLSAVSSLEIGNEVASFGKQDGEGHRPPPYTFLNYS
eukprot:SAG11_NODE_3042_length_2738_cov_1.067450_1_plen_333_part_10